ncbi:MAG TPA: hypothetical protein G4O02_14500 [Caldilineae bacterium]|nr:hypothetical protein [Caldilineae bacterium]
MDKGHGRLEVRRLWMVPCEADMEKYLEETFGWPGVQWCGWIERHQDVTMNEDRLHGRQIAAGLSSIRNVALNLLRRLVQAPYFPDARRKVAVMLDYGLHLLSTPLLEF